ncbi:MAG: hypothetical protein ACYSSP_14480 [Planctomycetota bacterium]|jgi:hypothetical protein
MSGMDFTRRGFLKATGIFTLSMMTPKFAKAAARKAGPGNSKPNIIFIKSIPRL